MDDSEAPDEADIGEVGGLLLSPDKIVSDCNLIARYQIRPELRALMVGRLEEIIRSSPRSRERIAAVRALTQLDKLNIYQEQSGKNTGITVNIVNQNQVMQSPETLVQLSDDDLMRIAGASGGGTLEAESRAVEHS